MDKCTHDTSKIIAQSSDKTVTFLLCTYGCNEVFVTVEKGGITREYDVVLVPIEKESEAAK